MGHVAGGTDAMEEEPALVIETTRIHETARAAQLHIELPVLAGAWRCRCRFHAEPHPRRHPGSRCTAIQRLHIELETPEPRLVLGQAAHPARERHLAALIG